MSPRVRVRSPGQRRAENCVVSVHTTVDFRRGSAPDPARGSAPRPQKSLQGPSGLPYTLKAYLHSIAECSAALCHFAHAEERRAFATYLVIESQ